MPASTKYINSMEWVGEAHNAGVKYVLENLRFRAKHKPDQEECEALATKYIGSLGISGGKLSNFQRHPDLKVVVSSMVEKGLISKKGARTLSDLFGVVDRKLPLQRLLKEFIRQEKIAATVLTGSDLLFFQAVAAVGRHSAQLWAPLSQGGQHYYQHGSTADGAPCKEIDWGEVWVVDMAFIECGPVAMIVASVVDLIIQYFS